MTKCRAGFATVHYVNLGTSEDGDSSSISSGIIFCTGKRDHKSSLYTFPWPFLRVQTVISFHNLPFFGMQNLNT